MTITHDVQTFRRAIRMADMIVRRARDRVLLAGLSRGRVKDREREIANAITAVADELWESLGNQAAPPTYAEAMDWDRRVESDWPKLPEKFRMFWPTNP